MEKWIAYLRLATGWLAENGTQIKRIRWINGILICENPLNPSHPRSIKQENGTLIKRIKWINGIFSYLRKSIKSQSSAFSPKADHKFPLASCSLSRASNKALKFPLPKLLAPLRWMISKNSVGLSSSGLLNICKR